MRHRYELVAAEATAGEFHARSVPDTVRPEIWWHRVTRPAVVLGSTQPDDVVDAVACRDAGVEVVRRRSGGGAVLLVPDEVTWIDLILPRGAPGWADDVHAPMVWLGRHLAAAFDAHGAGPVDVHDGKLRSTRWSSMVCFDGLGPGEVVRDGEKLVGMSQRRTRGWARLQCCWYSRYDHSDLLDLLDGAEVPTAGELGCVATVAPTIAALIPTTLLELLDD